MKNIFNVAVLGSTGYVGMELVKILSKHGNININFLGSETKQGKFLTNIENNKEYNNLPILQDNNNFEPSSADYVFIALPHGVSNKYVKKFFNKINIIDLSADFRLDDFNVFKKYYGDIHECKELISEFVYGLVEINRKKISKSKNFAVPGCYPTSILLPLIPLIKNNLIQTDNIIIDSKSGFSGAGKKFDLNQIKTNDNLNFYNYNTNNHRHISEIKQELSKYIINQKINFSFNPHILPNFRGMISTIYCDLSNNINKKNIIEELKNFEKNNTFIKYIEDNEKLDFFSIQNTNYCKIKIFDHHSDDKIIIVSGIDNLIKGASGQAVQCFNLSAGLEETTALL